MDRELYRILDLDFRICKRNKHFQVSEEFKLLHRYFVDMHDSRNYFQLTPKIKVKRKDQLLLNLQYNNLLNGIYTYEDYLCYTEEFFTYVINYELTTGNCAPNFADNIQEIYQILNKF